MLVLKRRLRMLPEPAEVQSTVLKAAALYEMLRAEWPALKAGMPWDGLWRDWTVWILGYFHDKGKELQFTPETKPLPDGRGNGEYLVDLCWWKEQGGQYWLELILESEWQPGKSEIDQDFYKLIDVKSRLKVWVCSWGEKQMQTRQSELSGIVAKARFKLSDEEYLIINMPDSQKAEYKDCVVIDGFWMNNSGNPSPLRPLQIHRNS